MRINGQCLVEALLIIICADEIVHFKKNIIIIVGSELMRTVAHGFIHIAVNVYLIVGIIPVV